MTPEQELKEIESLYKETMEKLKILGVERNRIVDAYIDELEQKKINTIKESL